jgi:phosphate transport system substrate-binding protein
MSGSRSTPGAIVLLALILTAPSIGAQEPLTGAGTSFLDPVVDRWFATFTAQSNVPVLYDASGQAGGINSLLSGAVDFALSDRPWSRSLLTGSDPKARQFPIALGATVVTYNLPTLRGAPLRLDGAVLADLFLGRIQRWNDPRIARLNPGRRLPAAPVRPVYRSDGAATTQTLTGYLSQTSATWRDRVGAATSVAWPTGTGGRGNPGVAREVAQEVGSIGYVDLSFAIAHRLPYAELQNRAGRFVAPDLASLQAAVPDPLRHPGPDSSSVVLDDSNPGAYPCTSLAWIVVRAADGDPARAGTLGQFVRWLAEEASRREVEGLLYPATAGRSVGAQDDFPSHALRDHRLRGAG